MTKHGTLLPRKEWFEYVTAEEIRGCKEGGWHRPRLVNTTNGFNIKCDKCGKWIVEFEWDW